MSDTHTETNTVIPQTVTRGMAVGDVITIVQGDGVVYRISDPDVANVDGNGIITAKKTGVADVTAVLPSGDILIYRITVNVAPEVKVTLGDLDDDGEINAIDASNVLIAAALIGAGKDSGLSQAQKIAADVDVNGEINAVDASIILQFAAAIGAGSKVALSDFT